MTKPVLLWCWWYDRQDLVTPLLPVMAEAENHFLFYRFPEQEKLDFELPGTRHYWTEYKSPYHIIEDVKPDKVVFMGIENMLTIALLSACRKVGIKTFYLAHGLTSGYNLTAQNEKKAVAEETHQRYRRDNPVYHRKKLHSLLFYLNAWTKAKNREKFFLMRFFALSFVYRTVHERLYKNKSRFRLADTYLVFTKHLSRLLKERDAVDENKMIEIGPYSLDSLFKTLSNSEFNKSIEPYVLMIDQPIVYNMSQGRDDFWDQLATSWAELGYRLKVKLHPMDYEKPDPKTQSQIDWIRDKHELNSLIVDATVCMGYFSAMLLPIIWFKKVILFNPTNHSLVEEWKSMGMVDVLDYKDFDSEHLLQCLESFEYADRKLFLERFIYNPDGRGTCRLIFQLTGNSVK